MDLLLLESNRFNLKILTFLTLKCQVRASELNLSNMMSSLVRASLSLQTKWSALKLREKFCSVQPTRMQKKSANFTIPRQMLGIPDKLA